MFAYLIVVLIRIQQHLTLRTGGIMEVENWCRAQKNSGEEDRRACLQLPLWCKVSMSLCWARTKANGEFK